jgi:hypothetical protein
MFGVNAQPCPYCSSQYQWTFHGGQCPKIKAIEYFPNGQIKRVEFRDDTDLYPPLYQPYVQPFRYSYPTTTGS